MIDPVHSFSAMLRETLGEHLNPDAETFVQMFAENGVMEFPFALPNVPQRVEGREALSARLAALAGLIEFDSVSNVVKHGTSDPEVFIIEFAGFGKGLATGEPFEQRYISVIRIRDGQIVHYKDYWNPVAFLRAMRGSKFVESLAAR
jgi:ketosteroid isomerase-like protein